MRTVRIIALNSDSKTSLFMAKMAIYYTFWFICVVAIQANPQFSVFNRQFFPKFTFPNLQGRAIVIFQNLSTNYILHHPT